MEIRKRRMRFRWIKAHAGTSGTELADKLAKEASGKTELPITYNRVPKSAIKKELEGISLESGRENGRQQTKGV